MVFHDVVSIAVLVDLITDDLRSGRRQADSIRAVRQFIADARRRPDVALADLAQPPASTGSEQWDAMIAAAVDMVVTEHGGKLPVWLRDPESLEPWWFVNGVPALAPRSLVQSPPSFAMRGVFIQRAALENA